MASESENPSTNTEPQSVQFSQALSAITRFILPIALLLLALNYVRVTYGDISWRNLRYPYLIIASMIILTLLIMFEEIIELRNTDFTVSTREAVENYVSTWRIPIKFAFLLVLYAILIPTLGFFSGSAVFMIGSMYVTSVGNRAVAAGVIIGTLVLIWLLFVEIVNIRPPQGVIDEILLRFL